MQRDAPFDNLFPFLCKPTDTAANQFNSGNSISFMFHNVRGLRNNLRYINSDFATQNAEYLMFVECHTHEHNMDNLPVKGHKMKHSTIGENATTKHGMTLYVPTMCDQVSMIACNSTFTVYNKYRNSERLEMVVYQHMSSGLFVCYLYNHPDNE